MREGIIYSITNLENGKRYIGRTINPKARKKYHIDSLKEGCHHNNHLQSAWDKYGEENFVHEVIEEQIPENMLDDREQHWINYYDSFEGEGYNQTSGGYSFRHSEETLKKLADREYLTGEDHPMHITNRDKTLLKGELNRANEPKKKLTFKKCGIIIKDYYNSHLNKKDLADKYNLNLQPITDIVLCEHPLTRQKVKHKNIEEVDEWEVFKSQARPEPPQRMMDYLEYKFRP